MKKVCKYILAVLLTGSVISCSSNKKIELELFSTKPESVETIKRLAAKYEKEMNFAVKINVVTPEDANLVLRSRIVKGDWPDLVALGGDYNYKQFSSQGAFVDFTKDKILNKIQPSFIKMLTDINVDHSDKVFAVPYATNGSGIIYNKRLFEKAGVQVPKTWSELVQVTEKLKKAGIQPFELTFSDSWTTLPIWNSVVPSLVDSGFIEKRYENETTFAETHSEVLEKFLFILNNAQGRDIMNTGYSEGNRNFATEKAAMMINGSWSIPEFIKINPALDVDIFPFPASDDESKNYVTTGVDVAFAIGAKSTHKKSARQFINFMLREDNASQYIEEQFAFSTIKGVDQNHAYLSGLKKIIASGQVCDYPDHYYPSGYDLSAILLQFASNHVKGVPDRQNISTALIAADKLFDSMNIEIKK